MLKIINNIFYKHSAKHENNRTEIDDAAKYMTEASRELEHAENLLNNADTPELIDYAIHRYNAARAQIDNLRKRVG